MWRRVLSYLLGPDVFLSYGRDDGLEYAQRLYARLMTEKPGTAVFADWVLSPIGSALPSRIRWALWRARRMVVILTPGSVKSEFVRQEVETFARVPRLVIPILASGATRPDWRGLAGAVWLEEPASAFARGAAQPSERVVANIVDAIDADTQARRSARIAAGAVASILAAAAAAGAGTYFVRNATREMRVAEQRRARADAARDAAETAKRTAEEQQRAAEAAKRTAETAKEAADAQAQRQREVAEATALASNAETLLRREPRHLRRATLLAAEAVHRFGLLGVPSAAADLTLRDALSGAAIVRERIPFTRSFGMRAVSSNGRHLAALDGNRVELIDVDAKRRRMLELGPGDDPELVDLAFSGDDSHLLAAVWFRGTGKSRIRIWRTRDGAAIAPAATFDAPVEAVAMTTDGSHYATWLGDQVRVWNSATHAPASVALQHDRQLRMSAFTGTLRFTPSSRFLVAEGSHFDRVWEWRTASADDPDEQSRLGPRGIDFAFIEDELLVSYGPHGIAVSSLEDRKVRWASDSAPRLSLQDREFGGFAVNGRTVALIRGDTVEIYDGEGSVVARLPAPQARSVFMHGDRIATLGRDGMARVYDLRQKRELGHVAHPRGGVTLAFRPRGELVSVSWDEALFWSPDENGGDAVWLAPGNAFALAVAPDTGLVATVGHDDDSLALQIRDAKSGAVLAGKRARSDAYPHALAYGRNGVVAVGTDGGEVFVWNGRNSSELAPLQPRFRYRIDVLALSPSSRYLAAAIGPHVFVWDLANRERAPVRMELADSVRAMAFRGEGELVASCDDARLRFLRWRARRVQLTIAAPASSAVVVTEDGLVGTAEGSDVVLREGRGRVVERIPHASAVGVVAAAGPGLLASAAADGLVRLWERRGGASSVEQTRVRLEASGEVPWFFAVTPNGRYLVSSDFETLRMRSLDAAETRAFACSRMRTLSESDAAYRRVCAER